MAICLRQAITAKWWFYYGFGDNEPKQWHWRRSLLSSQENEWKAETWNMPLTPTSSCRVVYSWNCHDSIINSSKKKQEACSCGSIIQNYQHYHMRCLLFKRAFFVFFVCFPLNLGYSPWEVVAARVFYVLRYEKNPLVVVALLYTNYQRLTPEHNARKTN